MKFKKNQFKEKHKYTVIEVLEEIYPMTGQKLIRPKLYFGRVVLTVLLTLIGLGGVAWGLLALVSMLPYAHRMTMSYGGQFTVVYLLCLLVCVIICAKQIAIFAIRVYQRWGSYPVRCMCVFIPNCSEYMILAIEKYGLIKGIKKGLDRLDRCHEPNVGEDYP